MIPALHPTTAPTLAPTNQKGCSAGATEAWFRTNDFYPLIRAELKLPHPDLAMLLAEIRGE
jgi:hypothetical protein